jgi:WD40 repeat protein
MTFYRYGVLGIRSAIGLFLALPCLQLHVLAAEIESTAGRSIVMMPAPRTVLKDPIATKSSSTISLDPSGRAGTIVVSSGSEGDAVLAVAFTPDGRWLLAGRDRGNLDVWDTRTWTKVRTVQTEHERVTALATSPDLETVATGGDDKTVKIWRITTGDLVMKVRGCKDAPDELVFSPDGRFLATVVNGGPDFVYDLSEHSVVKKLPANGFAFFAAGDVLVTALAEKLSFWSIETWKVTREIPDPGGHMSKVILDEKRNRAVIGGWEGYGTKIWDLSTGKPVAHFDSGFVAALAISPDGRWVFTAGDGFIRLWSAQSGKEMCTSSKLGLWDLAQSHDARWLAAGVDDTVQVWATDELMRVCAAGAGLGQP